MFKSKRVESRQSNIWVDFETKIWGAVLYGTGKGPISFFYFIV